MYAYMYSGNVYREKSQTMISCSKEYHNAEGNMSISEARRRANDKWREKFELIQFRVPKGKKSVIQEHAAQCGESLNGFINRAVDQALSADGEKK